MEDVGADVKGDVEEAKAEVVDVAAKVKRIVMTTAATMISREAPSAFHLLDVPCKPNWIDSTRGFERSHVVIVLVVPHQTKNPKARETDESWSDNSNKRSTGKSVLIGLG